MIKKLKGQYRFNFHYNKPAQKWSIHFKGRCYVVDDFLCMVPVEGHTQKTQPHRIARGFATTVKVVKGRGFILNEYKS